MLSVVPFGVLTLNAKENSKKHSNVIPHADELFDSNKMTELLKYLKSYQDSDSAGVQWRLARAYYKVSNLSTTARVDAERLAYKAMEHITKALELDNDSFACHEVGMCGYLYQLLMLLFCLVMLCENMCECVSFTVSCKSMDLCDVCH